MTEKKVEEVRKYVLVEVPTQHTLAVENPNGDTISIENAIVEILNKLDDIQRLLLN